MKSNPEAPKEPTGLRKLLNNLLCAISLLLGLLSLLDGIWYMVSPRHVGCFDMAGETLVIALPLSIGAVAFGLKSRFKLGYRTGYAGLILVFLSLVIPPFNPGRGFLSSQASALGSLRTLNTAEIMYCSTYPNGYSPSLSSLGPPPDGTEPSAKAAGLIDSTLAGTENSSEKSGYRFVYSPGPSDSQGRIASYSITASPIQPGDFKLKYFYTDQTGVIHFNATRTAGAADSPLQD